MITIQLVKNLRITGRVQGVGFREAMVERANQLGVRGWVRNRSDGSVEAVIAGEEAQVRAMVDWAHRGPAGAQVESVQLNELTSPGVMMSRFEPRPTV
jgi:acylphosphatase